MKQSSTPRVRKCRARAAATPVPRKPVQVTVAVPDRMTVRLCARVLNLGGEARKRLLRHLAITCTEVLPRQKRDLEARS